jgi:hypothetical protein
VVCKEISVLKETEWKKEMIRVVSNVMHRTVLSVRTCLALSARHGSQVQGQWWGWRGLVDSSHLCVWS